ncbi:MAG TPA: TetR/AcrR family transcriptional regulator [Chthoniobacterales bacterium]
MPRKSDAKQKLVDAANVLIWEQSYGSTSVDSICDKAGVKKGSFYYFFESKSELAVKALEDAWQVRKPAFDALFSPAVPPLERIERYFAEVYRKQCGALEQHGRVLGCPLFTLGSEISTQDQAIRVKVESILSAYLKYFESAIRDAHEAGLIEAPDAKQKARILFAYLEGSLTQARIRNDVSGLKDLAEGAFDILGAKMAQL